MSIAQDRASGAPRNEAVIQDAERIVRGIFGGTGVPAVIGLLGERQVAIGAAPARFGLEIRRPEALADAVIRRSPLPLAEAYFRGDIDITEGGMFDVLGMRHGLRDVTADWRAIGRLLGSALRLKAWSMLRGAADDHGASWAGDTKQHTREGARQAIAFHYDVSNDFYRTWLDAEMVYSCAYWQAEEDTLEQAQLNKLDHVCRKLRLKRGERLLDIGCGWGAMVCYAAANYGVRAHGITLSEAQLEEARRRIKDRGLEGLVTVELRDYRDIPAGEQFDKISSIGMFEHVGLRQMPEYNRTIYRALKPGGLFLNHGITHRTEGWNTGMNSEFLQRYVFPGGQLDTVSGIELGMERAGFEILDVEGLRPHYARTLRHWHARLVGNMREARKHVGEARLRVWLMYLAGSALEFETGGTGIHQILAGKWEAPCRELPMTRDDLYEKRAIRRASGN